MDFKIDNIEVVENRPFANCKLGREKYAKILEQIVGQGMGGCVMSLVGSWGTGKTTFVKMWKRQMENHGFKTIYFNAWENDYMEDPLPCLVAELKNLDKEEKAKDKLQLVISTAGRLCGSVLPKVAKGFVKEKIGEEAAEVVEAALNGTGEIFNEQIEKYEKGRKSIVVLRKTLTEYAEILDEDRPLVFFIDELDRCNPTYAVKVLERVKHLFSIPHIVFVLSVDKEQLCNSVRGYFGSDRINAEEYLRRFIDVEYTLPLPAYDKFVDYVFEKLDFKPFFENRSYVQNISYGSYVDMFKGIARRLFAGKNIILRQIEKILVWDRLVLQTIPSNSNIDSELMFLLLFIKHFDQQLYENIKKRGLKVQKLIELVEAFLPFGIYEDESYDDSGHGMIYIVAEFIVLYNKIGINKNLQELYHKTGANTVLNFNTKASKVEMEKAIIYYSESHRIASLDRYFQHIEMLVEIQKEDLQ